MTATLRDRVRDAVEAVVDPELRRTLGDLGMIREVAADDGHARIAISLTIAGCPAARRIESDVRSAAVSVDGVDSVAVAVGVMSETERADLVARLRVGRSRTTTPFTEDSLTRVIAVTSGKGGVGKSTVAANLALALAARGLRVGVLDADVHGFSIPGLLGLVDAEGRALRPTRVDDLILPPVAEGVKAVSIGMFLPPGAENSAVSWRGPMLHRTIEQFLTDVYFGDLDHLLIDMPPGTGDSAISVGQLLPHAEVLVVTTPQPAAAGVAVRSGLLARQLGQRVIGVVETMGPTRLPDGTAFEPFGRDGGSAVAARLSTDAEPVPVLGSIPFSLPLRAAGDDGTAAMVRSPRDPAVLAFNRLAERIATRPRGLVGRGLPVSPR
ncbi:MAG: P-loop NTPase [Microbacteriaceae bacterium]